jgi:hypothetical protein
VTIFAKKDLATGSSLKTFEVPAGRTWRIIWAHADLIASATDGGRRIRIGAIDDSGGLFMHGYSGIDQNANTTRHYEFMQGIYSEESRSIFGGLFGQRKDVVRVAIPQEFILLPKWKLAVCDCEQIDQSGDDLLVHFLYEELVYKVDV